jgi:hypothetical protein
LREDIQYDEMRSQNGVSSLDSSQLLIFSSPLSAKDADGHRARYDLVHYRVLSHLPLVVRGAEESSQEDLILICSLRSVYQHVLSLFP